MSATCDTKIERGHVVCSRCGGRMEAEMLWTIGGGPVPYLLWRCSTGHITQALPISYRVAAAIQANLGRQPWLGE